VPIHGNTSPNLHLSRFISASNRRSVMLCSPCSNRNSVEGVIPSFRVNSA
jgi:hypothetical protein